MSLRTKHLYLLFLAAEDDIYSGDEKALKRLTISDYQELLIKRLRQQNPSYVYVWKYHGESKPGKVVSIRAEEVNMSSAPLKFGNRLLVQACVKFETMQVRIYAILNTVQ